VKSVSKYLFLILLFSQTALAQRYVDADKIRSTDHSKVFTFPPVTGTLSCLLCTETLTNKTIAAGSNTITGLTNTNLSGTAGITYANLNLTGALLNADISASAAIAYSKLNLTGALLNADISASAAIANSKLATMPASTVKANITGGAATPTDVSLVSTATASSSMFRDANANVAANSFLSGYRTTATAAGTTTLTVIDAYQQFFTGTTTQTVVLPVASTMTQIGQGFLIVNNSTGTVTVNSSGSNLVVAVSAGSSVTIDCVLLSGITAASWSAIVSGGGGGGGGGVNDDVGTIFYSGSSIVPAGTLLADGSAISRTVYSALFAKIGTTYGVGDGTTTFNLPNAQGVFIRGNGSQTIAGIVSTGTAGTTQGDQLQSHTHVVQKFGSGTTNVLGSTNAGAIGNGQAAFATGADLGINDITITTPYTDGTNGTPRVGSETRPANIAAYAYIRFAPTGGAPSTNQVANTVYSGPASGGALAPTFRGLVAADLPVQAVQTINAAAQRVERYLIGSTAGGCLITSTSDTGASSSSPALGRCLITFGTAFGAAPTCVPAIIFATTFTFTAIVDGATGATTAAHVNIAGIASATYAAADGFSMICMGAK
jgi:microcystin-dependent protein